MKKLALFSVSLLSLVLLGGCNDKTNNDDKVEEKKETLFTYLNEVKDSENYVMSISGTGSAPLSSTTYDRTYSFSKNAVKYEEKVGKDTVISGLINKDGNVYTYKHDGNDYYLDNVAIGEDYHDSQFTLRDLQLDTYLDLENNNYNFELSLDANDQPVKYIDYYNVYVLASMLKIGSQIDYVAGARLSFNKDTKRLGFELVSYLSSNSSEYINQYSVEFLFENRCEDVITSLVSKTYSKPQLNEKFETIKELTKKGYGIKNYTVNGNDGYGNSVKFTGDIVMNDRYCIYDYSSQAFQALQGFFAYEGAVFYIQPNGTNSNYSKVISKKELIDLNKENNTNYTAIDLARLLFYNTFGLIPIELTSIYQNENLITYNEKLNLFMSEDYFNLLGFSGDLDSMMMTTIVNPNIRPLSFTLSYHEAGDSSTTDDDLINVGYIGYSLSNSTNGFSYQGNYRLNSYSNFGMTNEVMEFIFENSLPNYRN